MAWDVEGTKRRLLEAATAEFSEHGLAGARVDRIAASAGVNKERIYSYFGSKRSLFAAVLTAELARAAEAVQLEGTGVAAVTGYAARMFDHQQRHPELARLTFWEGLESGEPVAEDARRAVALRKVERMQQALPGVSAEDAAELLLTILTLCDGWPALANMDRLYSGDASRTAERVARRRASIIAAVEAAALALAAA